MSQTIRFRVALGDKVKDTISGYTGICSCVALYLNGCSKVLIDSQSLKDDGKPHSCWFDEAQVKVVQAGYYQSPGQTSQQSTQVAASGGPVSSLPPT